MAELTTAQLAPILVTTQYGLPVPRNSWSASFSDPTVATVNEAAEPRQLIAVGPGSGTLTVVSGPSSATLDVTVTTAPITVALGDPVAK